MVTSLTAATNKVITEISLSSRYVIPAFLIFGGLHWLLSLLQLLDFISYFYFTTFPVPYNLEANLESLITILNQALFPITLSEEAQFKINN